jgi:hypothetical protein
MKKAQAALEFLTTYGWAFLVILVMIGALAYFGVLNPGGILPGRCTMSPEVTCLEYEIVAEDSATNAGIVRFRVRNNLGAMADFEFGITEISNDASGTCSVTNNGDDIRAGRIVEANCSFADAFPAGDKMKFEVMVNYTKAGGSYKNPIRGEIYGEAR